ncbi:MAG: hypothetical protein KGM99_05760 [Burkholderiales bacterium]|nr:hypothetical protein [Burkholderiales bacterium]
MTSCIKQHWSSIADSELSEATVRALHQPAENFRVYVNEVAAATPFSIKAGHDFVLYVLEGACTINVDNGTQELIAGEFVQLQAGVYPCQSGSQNGVRLIKVFSRVA